MLFHVKQAKSFDPGQVGQPPRAAAEIYGERLPIAEHYAHLLATTGIDHGLLGPREAPKIWERHIVNCAIMESLLPHRARVIDIGSGAGLPGLALAIARPDLRISLVEPLARRTTWLEQAVGELGLSHVTVHRARAESMVGLIKAEVVTARAVARLDQLVAWAWPLLPDSGRLLAVKGQSATQELVDTRARIEVMGCSRAEVHVLGEGLIDPPVRIVEVLRSLPASANAAGRGRNVKRSRR